MPVVISDSLYLAAQAGSVLPLTHARIMYDSYTLDPATVATASSETAGFEADSVLDPATYSRWVAAAAPATLTLDLGSAKDVDYVMLAGHNFASAGVTAKVEYSFDSIMWTEIAPDRLFADNRAIAFLFTETTARYWRVVTAGGVPRVAVVYLGLSLAMERPIYGGHSPATLSRRTTYRPTLSENGQFLGRSVTRRGLEAAFEWSNLTANWYRENFDPFVKAARFRPFGIAWRPERFPNEVAYMQLSGDISPTNQGVRNLMSVGFSGIGFDEEDV